MANKKVIQYQLKRHKWPDEIKAENHLKRLKVYSFSLCLICFIIGFLIHFIITPISSSSDKSFDKLNEVYSIMQDDFYFANGYKNFASSLIDGALNGMSSAGKDIHTMYFSPQESKTFTSSMEGSYVGIGIQFYGIDENTFIIDRVFADSPAQKAGIMPGDRIYAINDTLCENTTTEKIAARVTGESGSSVKLEIIRENTQKSFEIKREKVLSTVFSDIKNNVATIELSSFADTSGDEFENHLKKIAKANCKKLIIDLRDNGGGYLVSAQQIASYLLPSNLTVFQEKDIDNNIKKYTTLDSVKQYRFDNIYVVVNQDTASAAEVLSAALKESVNATIIGDKTYGKGTVQLPITFKDGSMFKYTTAEWYTSKGKKINGKGIEPDVAVSLDPALRIASPQLKKNETYAINTVNPAASATQTYLKFLGYPIDRNDAYFSIQSGESLKQYQKDKNLPIVAQIDADNLSSLISSVSQYWHNHPELDTQMMKASELANGK